MLKNSKCEFSFVGGDDKNYKGTFIEFAPQVIYNDAGEPFQTTKAIIIQDNGQTVTVEPAGVKFLETK